MVNGIGSGGGGARDAIKAAIQRQAEARTRMGDVSAQITGQPDASAASSSFGDTFKASASEINSQLQASEKVIEGVVSGEVTDFHEIAAQVKQADLSFKFAMAVRNKFIDAYREVMRMSV
jgi:flagellar hook-basal body complex protein FliE